MITPCKNIRNRVINLHATLFQDYQQIGNISKTTSKFTSKSGSRRFLPREQQLFPGGCFEMFSAFGLRGSELSMPWCHRWGESLSPLPSVLQGHSSPRCNYRLLPNLTDFLPIFRTFLGELDSRLLEFHQLVII